MANILLWCIVHRWILKQLGDDLTESDINDMIADVDTDGSGWVDFDGTPGLYLHIISMFRTDQD